MVTQAQAAWQTQLCLQALSKESCVPAAWDVSISQESSSEWHWENNQTQSPLPCASTQHWDWHTHTGVHTLLCWITTLAAHQIFTSMTRDVYHYSQEVNPWAAMQNIPSQCQQDFQTPHTVMQLDWSHIFKELMVFSCWKTFEMSLAGLFCQEISFCLPRSHQHWSNSVYQRKKLGYSKGRAL